MAETTPFVILNQVHAIHVRSLPQYLASAPPWTPDPESPAIETLHLIAADQQVMANRVAAVILEHGGIVFPTEFPMEFTDLHDLSMDFILKQVIERQDLEIEFLRSCAQQLEPWPTARAITEEAIGAAVGHLDNLQELTHTPLGVAATP